MGEGPIGPIGEFQPIGEGRLILFKLAMTSVDEA